MRSESSSRGNGILAEYLGDPDRMGMNSGMAPPSLLHLFRNVTVSGTWKNAFPYLAVAFILDSRIIPTLNRFSSRSLPEPGKVLFSELECNSEFLAFNLESGTVLGGHS